MSPSELVLLSLGLSVATAGAGGAAAAMLERACGEAKLRERAWAWALYLPALPPLAVAALLLTPAPVRTLPAAPPVVGEPVILDVAAAAPVAASGPTIDMNQVVWLLLIGAALAVAVRLASLILRAGRLSRLVTRTAPASDVVLEQVARQARDLGVRPPRVRVGSTGSDALLAGGLRPVLVLPPALAEAPDTPVARAVIAHELSHLKRGDHRAVWLEEVVLTLLAANPVLPWIRVRRAAAREEACDALALTGPAAIDRRDYARGLIDALRASPSPTPMPALTFHGTQRSRAMRRLKSVLTPPSSAGRRVRLAAAVAGVALTAVAGLASAALAGQREAVWTQENSEPSPDAERVINASAADLRLFCAAPDGSNDRSWCDVHLWSAALDESRRPAPAFCTPGQDDAGLRLIGGRGRDQVLVGADTTGSAEEGARRALSAAFPCQGEGRQPTTAQVAAAAAELAPQWSARHAARMATESAARAAGLRALTPASLKTQCTAGGTTEAGCDGLIFGVVIGENQKPLASRTFCAPDDSAQASDIAAKVKSAVRRTPAQGAESGRDFLRRVVAEAYPCALTPVAEQAASALVGAGQSPGDLPAPRPGTTRLLVRLQYGDKPMVLTSRDRLRVGLEGASGDVRSVSSATWDLAPGSNMPGLVWLDLGDQFFPNQGAAAYTLTARIERGEDGPAVFAADPTTIRLAPMSQGQVARMRPELLLRPVTAP